jgi:hypothetical protein
MTKKERALVDAISGNALDGFLMAATERFSQHRTKRLALRLIFEHSKKWTEGAIYFGKEKTHSWRTR